MSKVKIQGNSSGTGTFTISAPNSNTDRSLTLPDGAGEILTDSSTLSSSNLSGALPALDGSALTGISGGIEYFDAWRLASDQTVSGGNAISSGWEQDDTAPVGLLGTGMTESSGVFTFPATGIWKIDFFASYLNATGANSWNSGAYITVSQDSGSTNYSQALGMQRTYDNGYMKHISISTTLDVTNTSTCQVYFECFHGGDWSVQFQGNTNWATTAAKFTRLGDT